MPEVEYPDCPCCGVECCGCHTTQTLRSIWNLSVAGITNGTCSGCSEWNGDFELKWGSACNWADQADSPSPCQATPLPDDCYFHYRWLLNRQITGPSGDGYYLQQLTDLTGTVDRYFRAIANWDCTGSNVMSFLSDPEGVCTNWPATVTVTPGTINVGQQCRCWPPYPAIAEEWVVEADGFDGDTCCEAVNGDHRITKSPVQIPPGIQRCYGSLSGEFTHCSWGRFGDLLGGCEIHDPARLCISMQYDLYTGRVVLGLVLMIEGGSSISRFGNYWMHAADFNPVGANTFDLVGGFNSGTLCGSPITTLCTTAPATIQVVPG